MKNAIIYSIHSSVSPVELNQNFRQLRYSIDTLRQYNKEIPIKVYLSPIGIFDTRTRDVRADNIEYIEFNAVTDSRFYHEVYALWTSHKWPNAFDALEKFDYDNVLYVDADTLWHNDPEKLFTKYGNTNHLWCRNDTAGGKFHSFTKLNATPINDGVNLISKQMLKYKDQILQKREEMVLNWQKEYEDSDDEEIKGGVIHWAAGQYAISEYMASIDNPVHLFDDADVCYAEEYFEKTQQEVSNLVVCHYFNFNTDFFLPKYYSSHVKDMEPIDI
jgi:hypothetical protein